MNWFNKSAKRHPRTPAVGADRRQPAGAGAWPRPAGRVRGAVSLRCAGPPQPQGGALQGQNRTDDPFPVAGLPVAAGAARRRQPPQLELRSGQPVEPAGGAGAGGRQPLGRYLLVSHRSEQRAAGSDRRGGQPVLVRAIRHLRQAAGPDGGRRGEAAGRAISAAAALRRAISGRRKRPALQPVPLLRTRGGAFHHAGSDRAARRVEPVSVCAEPADVGGSAGAFQPTK